MNRTDATQVASLDEGLGSRGAALSLRFWNICSMRSVIMKPPTTLIVAAVTAMKPRTVASVL